MNVRNKISSQILEVANKYDLEIVSIEFNSYGFKSDEVTVIYKQNNIKQTIIYNYAKDNIHEIRGLTSYINYKLQQQLMEGK